MHKPRIYRCDGFSGLGLDEFIVDEESPGLLVFSSIGCCELHEEVRHVVLGTVVSPQRTTARFGCVEK
jgi:hypothetical protein